MTALDDPFGPLKVGQLVDNSKNLKLNGLERLEFLERLDLEFMFESSRTKYDAKLLAMVKNHLPKVTGE